MKVELQCGDTITIPEGCKAVVKDGSVTFVKEEVQEFKDGDVLVVVVHGQRHNAFIYKSTDKRGFHSYYVGLDVFGQLSISESPSNRWSNSSLSYATEEEKQILFDKMEEQGLRWDAEEKRVEKIRWRAKKDGYYYYINRGLTTTNTTESGYNTDTIRYSVLNYFRTKEHAEEAARRVREALQQYHEEIGE